MPLRKGISRSEYEHKRIRPPGHFRESSLRTVPAKHSRIGRKMRLPRGSKAVVGKLKPGKGPRGKTVARYKWGTQAILIPKRR